MENQKKNRFQKILASMLCLGILCLSIVMLNEMKANAAEQTINVNDGDSLTVQVHPGDTGTIVPNPDSIDTSTDYGDDDGDNGWDDDWDYSWDDDWDYSFGDGSYGTSMDNLADDSSNTPTNGTESQEIVFEYTVDDDEELPGITVDASGNYQILDHLGEKYVYVTGSNSQGQTVFQATICFEILVDMTDVTLQKTNVNGYLVQSSGYGDYIYYDNAEIDIKVKSQVVLSEELYGIGLDCKTSSKKVWAYATLSDNVLHLSLSGDKKSTVTVTVSIAGKKFKITVHLKPVKISTSSVLLEKGKTKQLKVRSWPGSVQWSSSDNSIATVSKNGTVKGKKTGNVVITAKIGDKRVGSAVSVTTAQIKKVCKRGTYIGTHWEYSQPNRTQTGYYDCSALVWKAYKACAGLDFGNAYYPGTTVTESAWCRDHNRMVKGGYTYKKVEKMKINPGDIVFKSNDLKNPYGTTYHVEMFTGYVCTGYNEKGKPNVLSLWAARSPGYGAEDGSLLARPLK